MKSADGQSQLSVRNFNKKMKRKDAKINCLQAKCEEHLQVMQEFKHQNAEFKTERDKLEQNIDSLRLKMESLRVENRNTVKQLQYRKRKEEELPDKMTYLNDEISYWQAQSVQTEEPEKRSALVSTLDGRVFNDNTRRTVMELTSALGVSVNKATEVMDCVLKNMAGLYTERLPSVSTCKNVTLEARHVSLQQIQGRLMQEDNLTLTTDGTNKLGHKYGTAGICFSDGTRLHLGLREQASGSAQCTFDTIVEMVHDVINTVNVEGDRDKLANHIFSKITNLVGDRASTEKKFNEILSQYRMQILPDIVEGYAQLPDSEKSKLAVVNELFCGMHVIDGLAHQTGATLDLWETLVFKGDKVGSAKLDLTHKSGGESGTVRLIRTVCKTVQERGCEKSGKPVEFRTFLLNKNGSDYVPLVPFKGNRINVMFHNAAGVYYLYPDLLEYTRLAQNENRLVQAVHADLNVTQFIAGCRALGLISKQVTEPFWRVLSKKEHVLAMNDRYRMLVKKLKEWQADSRPFMKGEVALFEDVDVHRGPILDKLLESSSEEFDDMTQQVLELVFASLVKVCCRLVADHLEHGRYDDVSEHQHNVLRSVPKTNVACERDFGIFDYLIRSKFRASKIALEGMIMFKQNRSWEWLSGLDPERRAEVLVSARTSVKEQRALFCERMCRIREDRLQVLRYKQDRQAEREVQAVRKKQQLTLELGKYGGLWTSDAEVSEQVSHLGTADLLPAVVAQLKFRRLVLGQKNDNGVFNISKLGKRLPQDQLISNLRSVVVNAIEPQDTSLDVTHVSAPADLIADKKLEFLRDAAKQHLKAQDLGRRRGGLGLLRLPSIEMPEQLLGKRVNHLYVERGSDRWFNGTVLDIRKTKDSYLFRIKYDGYRKMYWLPLWTEYQENRLKLLPVGAKDLVGKKIEHMFISSEDGGVCWWPGRVVSFNGTDGFLIDYEEEEDDEVASSVLEYPLLTDYYENEVRIYS